MGNYASLNKPWMKFYDSESALAKIPQTTLYQYAYENNKEHLNDIAFRYFDNKITYKKLFEHIQQTAKAFQSMGIQKGDIVTIMSMHTPETIYSLYALNYLGAAANMVYMTLSPDEIIEAIKNTSSKLFLILETALEQINTICDKIDIPVIVLPVSESMSIINKTGYKITQKTKTHNYKKFRDIIHAGKNINLNEPATDADNIAVIVYTSGTTGEPKGVMLSSYNINSVVFQYKLSGMHFGRGETYLDIIPLFLSYGVSMLQLAVSMGIDTTLFIIPGPKEIAREFAKVKPNHFASGPVLLDEIMKNVDGNMGYLINFTGGGAALSLEKEEELNRFLKAHGSNVKYATGYGMTELSASVSACNNNIYKTGSLGVPLPKANVKIIDINSNEELPIGQTGEICFHAPNIMLGYFKNPQATNEIIDVDNQGLRWLHTGDLGCLDSDGFLFFKGKLKRIFVVQTASGMHMKLFPQRIEELFETLPDINRCGVIALEDKTRLHIAIAFVTKKQDSGCSEESLIDNLYKLANDTLPEHSQPQNIIILNDMPITASGKIDYRTLEKIAKSNNPI